MLSEIREKGWAEFTRKHNNKPNFEAALIWALDEIFWRVRYLVGDDEYVGVATDYWEDDIITAWIRSYRHERG